MALREDHSRTDAADETAASTERDPEVVNQYPGTGVTTVLLALFVVFVAGIIVLAQNTADVAFQFLWWDLQSPLIVLLLVAFAVGATSTLGVAGIWRHRRRRSRREREELQRLRRNQR